MIDPPSSKSEGFQFSKLFQYFLQGLLVIAPVVITVYAVYWVVSSIDSLLPIFTEKDSQGNIYIRNYGLGFVIIIVTICLIGYLSSFFIKNRLFNLFDSLMTKTPGIRFIYTTVKDFFEAFAGEKKKFNKPVLANIDDNDVWRVGFITQEEAGDFGSDFPAARWSMKSREMEFPDLTAIILRELSSRMTAGWPHAMIWCSQKPIR